MILLCEQWLTLPLNHNPYPNPEQCQRFKVSFLQQVIVLVSREEVFSFDYLCVVHWTFVLIVFGVALVFLRALVVGVFIFLDPGFGVISSFPGNTHCNMVCSMSAWKCSKLFTRLSTLWTQSFSFNACLPNTLTAT